MMTRLDFFVRLRDGLRTLPSTEVENAVRYYTEYFDDAGPDNEQRVLEELGDPAKIAQQICAEYMVRDIVAPSEVFQEEPKKKRGLSAVWIAILAVFASPIALPIAIGLAAAALGLVIAAASVFLALFVAAIAMILAGLACVVIGFCILGVHLPTALFGIGSGCCVIGVGLLIFLPTLILTKVTFHGIARLISKPITRRNAA